MKRDEVNQLIAFATDISTKVEQIESAVYSSEDIEDTDLILARVMSLKKLSENLNGAIRGLDESTLTPEEILKRELEG